MKLLIPTPEEAEYVLRSCKQVAIVDHILGKTPRALLAAAQKYILKTDYDLDTLEPITPQVLSQCVTDPELRRQLVQAMVVLTLATGNVQPEQFQRVAAYAQALQVPQSTLKYLHQLCQRRLGRLKIGVYRQSFISQRYQLELGRQGLGWFLKGLLNYTGLVPDRALAERYYALERLPETSLGHQFWQFSQTHRYPFPGEKGGNHEGTCFHDVTHILAGYDTSAAGELQVVAMTVGYKQRGDPLASLFFILLQQHLGVQVGLLSPAKTGGLDAPGMPEKFIKALKRGSEMTVDLSEDWDHWEAFNHSVADLRVRYNMVDDRDRLE